MKSILLFNTNPNTKILLSLFNVKVIEVAKENQYQTIGYLLQNEGYKRNDFVSNKYFDDSLILFNDFKEDELDNMLAIIKSNNLGIKFKAIVTEYNINWPSYLLHEELQKELLAIKTK